MTTEKKNSRDLIPLIIEAKSDKAAIAVLHEVLSVLNFSNEYMEISNLMNSLEADRRDFKDISDMIEDCRGNVSKLFDMRLKINYFYRDMGDKYKAIAHRWKTYYQEVKTQRRAEALQDLKNNPEILASMGMKPSAAASSLREILGGSSLYVDFLQCLSLAESLQKSVDNFLDTILQFSNTVASMISFERNVEMKDVK